MVDNKPILDYIQEPQKLIESIFANGKPLSLKFQVNVVIAKLSPSWKDYKLKSMHKK